MTVANESQYDVFLSHSAKDKAAVRPLAERLRKDGLKVWFDEWVLKPGDNIPAKMEERPTRSNILRNEGSQMWRYVKLTPAFRQTRALALHQPAPGYRTKAARETTPSAKRGKGAAA